MAKKTPEEIFREAQKKVKDVYGAVQDPQFQQDVVANAKAMARSAGQGAMNLGNQIGNTMEKSQVVYPGAEQFAPEWAMDIQNGIRGAGTALKQGIYDLRTGGQPVAPYVNANQAFDAITGQAASDIYRAQHPSPYGMNISDAPYIEQAKTILQQAGHQINEQTIMSLVQELKVRAQQAGQAIQQAPQKGLDWARGLLQ